MGLLQGQTKQLVMRDIPDPCRRDESIVLRYESMDRAQGFISLVEDPLGIGRCESRERLRNTEVTKRFYRNHRGKEVGEILENCFIQ